MSEVDWQNVCKDKNSQAKHILQNKKFSDCQFLVGQESDEAVTIHGHKLILAMASPVFERMFYGSFNDENKSNEIRIPDMEPNIFHMMIEYIYFEKLELKTSNDAMELYSAANKYMLQNLKRSCIDVILNIKGMFEAPKLWKIYEFGVFFEENDLITKFGQVIANNFTIILEDTSFVDANLTAIITLFERDSLNIESELDLFQALNKYALSNGYFDTKNSVENKQAESEIEKRKLLKEALKKIRFLCLQPEEFDVLAKSGLLTESEGFSILQNLVKPNSTPMPEGFSNSRTPRPKWKEY